MDCPRCELIRDLPVQKHDKSTEEKIVLHRTIEELRDGLAASCWWCVAIAHHLQRGWTGDVILHVDSFTSMIIRDDEFYHIKMFHGSGSENETSFVYQKLSSPVKLERRTDSSLSWQYIRRRLRECEDLHKETCGSSILQNTAPTWLIKIEEQQDSRRRCNLVKTSSEALTEEYVTMSHRWQPELMDEKKLCTSKLRDYQNYIPIDELPKHYADAVEVTWKLGLRYLWIDFLCMVQDSEDLGQEIGKMTQIYHNAYCNLSATSADQGTEGIFFNRDYSRLPHIFRSSDNDYHCVVPVASIKIFEKLDLEPLYRRGWVCQERLLARRNISFTEDLIFIECQSSIDCEIGAPASHPYPLHPSGIRFNVKIGKDKEYTALRKLDRRNFLSFWMTIIEFYSQSELTYFDDRLTAISGVARYIANATEVDYLAGLWNQRLACQLTWYRRHPPTHTIMSVPPKDDTKVDKAPSWSWANTDGQVVFLNLPAVAYTPVVEILEAKCEGPYESKSTGFIRLHGWLLPFHDQGHVAMRPGGTNSPGDLWVDISLTQKLQVHWDAFPLEASISAQTFQELTKDCYALPLLFWGYALDGIIVKLTPTKEFRRVGKWCIGLLNDPNEQRSEGPTALHTHAPEVSTWIAEEERQFVRDAPYTLRALIDVFGECDLPFLETVHGGRRLITLV